MELPRRSLKRLWASVLAASLLTGVAHAQFSDSYSFLKAVKDADGTKVTELLGGSGSTVVDTKDPTTGETAMHIVTQRRDLAWMGFLIGKGARIDTLDRNGNTPLMVAAQLGFVEGAQMLITRQARVDLANNRGETPLIRAVQNRDVRMVRILLAAGANPDRTDTLAGMSARDYATRDTRNAAVLKLIDEMAKKKPTGQMGPN